MGGCEQIHGPLRPLRSTGPLLPLHPQIHPSSWSQHWEPSSVFQDLSPAMSPLSPTPSSSLLLAPCQRRNLSQVTHQNIFLKSQLLTPVGITSPALVSSPIQHQCPRSCQPPCLPLLLPAYPPTPSMLDPVNSPCSEYLGACSVPSLCPPSGP